MRARSVHCDGSQCEERPVIERILVNRICTLAQRWWWHETKIAGEVNNAIATGDVGAEIRAMIEITEKG